jgi:hypothetical protein
VTRLPKLSAVDLNKVEANERKHRNRKTVRDKIASHVGTVDRSAVARPQRLAGAREPPRTVLGREKELAIAYRAS